ncbi:hypothetical protein [Kitasatospora sp. NPDC015120]
MDDTAVLAVVSRLTQAAAMAEGFPAELLSDVSAYQARAAAPTT